jgi:hypothetical protein
MKNTTKKAAAKTNSKKAAAKTNSKKAAAKTNSKKAAEAKVSAKLAPVVAQNEDHIIETAFDGTRRRPVVAINDEGKLVVCCRRTATKYGWKLEGALFARTKNGKVLVDNKGELAVEAPAQESSMNRRASDKAPKRRASDKVEEKLSKVKQVIDAELKDILA